MAVTYGDAATTYDDADVLYDGIPLADGFGLIVNAADVTEYLADRSLTVHTATHGNSLGTLDATLNDPAALPVVEQAVDLYVDSERLYRGTVRSANVDEHRGEHLFASFTAQDDGPDEGELPTAAPFGISDDPDGTTTKGYESLRRLSRTTEGGSPKTTYVAVMRENGLYPGLNVEVTSANYGLAATEFTIIESTVSWPNAEAPKYSLTLGDPVVRLAQLVTEIHLEDDSITETMITDGAISTPKLAANAVTAEKVEAGAIDTEHLAATASIKLVSNDGADVVIDASGLAVTDGAITVTNGTGTVIIDGTSNMFKIQATGTLTKTVVPGDVNQRSSVALTGLGALPTTPAHVSFISDGNVASSMQTGSFAQTDSLGWESNSSGGATNARRISSDATGRVLTQLDGSNQCVVHFGMTNALTGINVTWYARYYVLKEAAL